MQFNSKIKVHSCTLVLNELEDAEICQNINFDSTKMVIFYSFFVQCMILWHWFVFSLLEN